MGKRGRRRPNSKKQGNGVAQPSPNVTEGKPYASMLDEDAVPVASTSRAPSIHEGSTNGRVHEEESSAKKDVESRNAVAQPSSSSGSSSSAAEGPDDTADGQAHTDSNSDNDVEEEAEEEEDEPTLRYSRIATQAVNDILNRDSCSCLTVSDKYLVLGSHNGLVTVYARPGQPTTLGIAGASPAKGKGKATAANETKIAEHEAEYIVRKYRAHTAGIMDIVIDEDSQYIGTASMDGKAIVYQIATNDAQAFDLARPLRCLALEPGYATKSARQIVTGGMAGKLTLHEKGWLGPKDVILHTGDDPVWSVQWRRNYIAWADDGGIRIWDTHTSSRIAYIPRAQDSPRSDLYPSFLCWQNDNRLVVGWADFIRVIDVRDRRYQLEQARKAQEEKEGLRPSSESIKSGKSGKSGPGNPLAGMGSYLPAMVSGTAQPQATYAEVTNVLQVDSMISGIVPFQPGNALAASAAKDQSTSVTLMDTNCFLVLSYVTGDSADNSDFGQSLHQASQPPELRIIDIASGEELSSDVLAISNYSKYQCRDYRIVACQSPENDMYFACSPTDLIDIQKRDVWDHIAWLCERRRFEEALQVVQRAQLSGITSTPASARKTQQPGFSIDQIGQRYLEHLFDRGEYETAARNAPKILGTDVKMWEDWFFKFVQRGEIQAIIPYVPVTAPRLDHIVYEVILAHYLQRSPNVLLQTLKTWPSDVYDANAVINAVKTALDKEDKLSPETGLYMESLIEIYMSHRQPGKALPYYLKLRKPGVFDLVRQHNLFQDVHDQVLLLVDFQQDMKRRDTKSQNAERGNSDSKHGEAIDLLIDHSQSIPASRVVKQLDSNRFYLYMYLDALAAKDIHLAFEYSDSLVDLYAEYEYTRLLDFLRASTAYDMEKAYDICRRRDYVPEMVFLLGRMGNNKQALMLIIERLGDVQRAIEFVKEQNDSDLWEDLLKYAETRPTFIRGLLENVGPEVDPIRLIRRIQNGLEIPGLKPAIIKILQDFNIQISLIEGCKTILNADCRRLTLQLYDGQTNATLASKETTLCHKCSKPAFMPNRSTTSTTASATTAEATSIMFLCRHVFHIACALPDVDFPSRPQHLSNPLLSMDILGFDDSWGGPLSDDKDRELAARVLFISQLRTRSQIPVSCPACVAGTSRKH